MPIQRALLRQVEELVQHIDRSGSAESPIHAMVDAIIRELRHDLGIYNARLYERDEDDFVLVATFPGGHRVEEDVRLPRTYAPVELCLMQGTVYMKADDPRLDRELEISLGVEEFAAVEIGNERYMLGFNLEPGNHHDDVVYSLGVVRHAINQKIREQELEATLHQAWSIQNSILPKTSPKHGPFDIAGRSLSLDSVGGDLFDFIPIHDKILGLAIADASGHGLPAALQVRDIYTGLRMGMARDFKIIRTVERLNQIIHTSTLTSRFVSMFYGELEVDGVFIYVNAGHPPPMHITASGQVTRLTEGGPILGPLPKATYDRGFVKIAPGDMLVMFTDGLTEAWGRPEGADPEQLPEQFGDDQLVELAKRHLGLSAQEVIDAIFARLTKWRGREPTDDDRTMMVITYPESAAE